MSHVDATRLGDTAARLMDDIAADDWPAGTIVRDALVVVELQTPDGDSVVIARASDDRNVVGLGLAQRATAAMLPTRDT